MFTIVHHFPGKRIVLFVYICMRLNEDFRALVQLQQFSRNTSRCRRATMYWTGRVAQTG